MIVLGGGAVSYERGTPVGFGWDVVQARTRKEDVRIPGKGNSNSHCARPVQLTITMIKWIRTSGLSIEDSLQARVHHIDHLMGGASVWFRVRG